MRVIGLTGGIGSGKSSVSRFLAELGAVIIDTDKLGHEAFRPGTNSWQEVVATFGEGILQASGEVDRSKLGEMVFNDTELLLRLNQIMLPRIYDMVKAKIEDNRKRGTKVVVLEAPLIMEVVDSGRPSLVDEVWVTVASEPTTLRRLKERSRLSRTEALTRIRSQRSLAERLKHADVVINNDGSLEELKRKVHELWSRLQLDT